MDSCNMPGRIRQSTFRTMQETLDEYNKLFESQLERPLPPTDSNSRIEKRARFFQWPNWTLWFAILIPMLIVFYSALVLH
uniref:Uncharacterized protein n=1 Tax=Acrobeloides nanus TaxID=290746 RepID=A0A914CGS7_9BILA